MKIDCRKMRTINDKLRYPQTHSIEINETKGMNYLNETLKINESEGMNYLNEALRERTIEYLHSKAKYDAKYKRSKQSKRMYFKELKWR